MNKNSDIQRRIDETLESIVNIRRTTPKPFFYTRLHARMTKNERSEWERISRLVTRPAVAAAAVSLVLLLNAFVIIQGVSAQSSQGELSEISSTEDLSYTTFYDIENAQP